MKRILKALYAAYQFIGRFGNADTTDPGLRKVGELYNKGWFFIFGAVFSNLIATLLIAVAIITTNMFSLDMERFIPTAKAYIWVEFAACLLLVLIFLSGRRAFLSSFGPIAIITTVFAYYVTLALFAGREAGIHYVLFQFFPVALIMNTRSNKIKFAFLLYMIVFTLIAFYALNIIPPLYPLPEPVVSFIFYMVLFFLVTYTVVALYFTIWHLNYIDRLVELWKKLTDMGSRHYSTESGIRGNRISNQLFMLFIAISVINFIAVTALIIQAVNINFERNIYYTVLFYPIWLFGFTSLIAGYHYKNKWGRNLLFELISIVILSVIFILFFIASGSGAGLHYYFSIFIVLPFFLNTESRPLKAGITALFLLIFLFMINIRIEGLYPFPAEIELRIKRISLVIIMTSFILSGVFAWVRFDVTARLVNLWDRLTERGFHLFTSEPEKRLRKIQSSIILIFLAMIIVCFLIEAGLLLHMYHFAGVDMQYITSAGLYYGSTSLLVILMLIVALYFQEKTRTSLPAILPFGPSIIWHFFMGISLSPETLMAYFKIILLPLPFIALDRRDREHRIMIVSGIVFIVLTLAANVAYHFHYEPLFPFPEMYDYPIALSVIAALTATLILMAYYFYKQTSNAEINLEKEKKKSNALLLNVLPEEIADELKEKGSSRPSRFDNVTVMFSDFHGFSGLAECMAPEELIEELDLCFSMFDKIIEKHGLEKLKTMGHTYMCAAGIPRGNSADASDCVRAAAEIITFVKSLKQVRRREGRQYWDVRIGINTGPVAAGVIGDKKFLYDIWGDTVNVASRILTTGVPGKINVSRSTCLQVKNQFKCVHRGKVMAKNKGKIDQYHVQVPIVVP